MMCRLIVLFCFVLVTGCASVPEAGTRAVASSQRSVGNCPALDPDQQLKLNLAQEMVTEGRLHAALANLESLPARLPEVRLRKARIFRLLTDERAEPLYSGLLNSCLDAEAHHGLGQIAIARENYPRARDYLDIAVRLAPTDDAIRNDRGLVLMHLGALPQARFDLLTAVELNPANVQTVENLLTLLIYMDQWNEAGELVRHRNVSPNRFQVAMERAKQMELANGSDSVSTNGKDS